MDRRRLANDGEIRLLIPKEWIAELDTLARLRNTSRLATIRAILRHHIDLELLRLEEHLTRREQVRKSKTQTDAWLESRKESDEW